MGTRSFDTEGAGSSVGTGFIVALLVISSAWSLYENPARIEAFALEVERGSIVRFFITNVASARTFRWRIPGVKMKRVGSDAGRYEREEWVESVTIGPAERYVIDARFDVAGEHAIVHESPVSTRALGAVIVSERSAEVLGDEQFSRLRANADVIADIGDRLDPVHDLVLDGGPCPVGVESTILDCTDDRPRVLRWGAVEVDEIERVGGRPVSTSSSAVRAPGGLASHYAPRAAVHLGNGAAPGEGFLALTGVPTPPGAVRLAEPEDTRAYAAVVYRSLRDADALGLPVVWAQPPADGSALAVAVRDRLARAAVR